MTTTCRTCVTPIGYINCPTGGWWAHEKHPADNHDAVPAAWVDNDPLMETIAETVWAHCRTEGTSLVVDDPRNIAATAAAVARHFAAAAPVPPPADQTALRERVAEALMRWAEGNNDQRYASMRRPETVRANAYSRATAVLAVLPEPVDRAAVLEEAAQIAVADNQTCPAVYQCQPCLTRERVAAVLLRAAATTRRVAAEEQPAETQARPPLHEWFVETRMLDGRWSKYGASRDTAEDGRELFERDTTGPGNGHAFRLVRATTTYVVEADHQPDTETQPAP